MEVSSVILIALSIILLLGFLVFSLELFVPIQLKLEMNNLLRPYMFSIEEKGVLTEEEKLTIIQDLEAIGLSAIEINVDSGNHRFGDKLHLLIKGHYIANHLVTLHIREEDDITMIFERNIYVRKITN